MSLCDEINGKQPQTKKNTQNTSEKKKKKTLICYNPHVLLMEGRQERTAIVFQYILRKNYPYDKATGITSAFSKMQ